MSTKRWALLYRRVIRDTSGVPYLIRYSLFETPWLSVKLHHILRSDADRHTRGL